MADSERTFDIGAYFATRALIEGYAEKERLVGVEMFMLRPDRWYEYPRWRCSKGHVSTNYLISTELGPVCLDCYEPVSLTFPEDKGGPLAPAESVKQPDSKEVRP